MPMFDTSLRRYQADQVQRVKLLIAFSVSLDTPSVCGEHYITSGFFLQSTHDTLRSMKTFLRRVAQALFPWLALVGFACLLVVGLVLFSWFLIIVAIIFLVVAIFGRLTIQVTRPNKPGPTRPNRHHGRTIDHQD